MKMQLLGMGPWEEIQAIAICADPKPTTARLGLRCARCGDWAPLIVWRGKAIEHPKDVPAGKVVLCSPCAAKEGLR